MDSNYSPEIQIKSTENLIEKCKSDLIWLTHYDDVIKSENSEIH